MSLYQFDCGHILSISHTGSIDGIPCPTCERKKADAQRPDEWVSRGGWCKDQRQRLYRKDKSFTTKTISEALGITVANVFSMEYGRTDPSVLVDYLMKVSKQ